MNVVLKTNFQANPTVHKIQDAQSIINQMEALVYKRNQYIYRENQNSDAIFFIDSGQILLSEINDEGKEVIKTILRKGDIFGEFAFLGNNERKERAKVKIEAVVRKISIVDLKQMLLKPEFAAFSLYFNELLVKKVNNIEQRWKSQVSYVARDRVIDFLIELMEKDGKKVGYEHMVINTLTHMEMANYLGTSRQTVTVVLNDLRDKNLIYFDRRRILIRNMDTLKAEKNN